MRVQLLSLGVTGLLMLGCVPGGPNDTALRAAQPSPTAVESLAEGDVQALVAVRGRALRKIEDLLAQVEEEGGRELPGAPDFSLAEREAATALGVEHWRYAWTRDRAAKVLAMQRQAEDRRLLVSELSRTRNDLLAQMAQTTDAASREFLQAQLRSVEVQVSKLHEEHGFTSAIAEEARLLETVRVELAILASREERLQEKLRQMVRKANASSQASADAEGRTRETPGSP